MKAIPTTLPTGNKGKRAFTFIELLFVVLIIGILVGIAVPNFRKTYNNLQLNSFAGELQAFMNFFHQRAIVETKVIFFNIDTDKREYWAIDKDAEVRLKTARIPEGMILKAGPNSIAFYPDGSIDNITINISNANNKAISLTSEGIYGGVKLVTQK